MPEQNVTVQARTVGELLDSYRLGDSFFSSASHSVHGSGSVAVADRFDLLPRLLDRGDPSTIVMGALPFDTGRPAHLVVPETVRTGPPPSRAACHERQWRPLGGQRTFTSIPTPETHVATVERAVKMLSEPERHGLYKVVLARSLRLECSTDLDVATLLSNLVWRDPSGFSFCMNLPGGEDGPRSLVGASPELLVSKSGRSVRSHPLAGSARRSADPTEDRARGAALLDSTKERTEHALVVEAIADTLAPFCAKLRVPNTPEPLATATMWHLSTEIEGELIDADTAVHELVAALHPTPAVCGTPTRRASEAIGQLETFDRGFYTGAVGYSDSAGNGEWVVTIRCADVGRRRATLFAGGGIMLDSDPEAELAETSAKLRTLLLALGVEGDY